MTRLRQKSPLCSLLLPDNQKSDTCVIHQVFQGNDRSNCNACWIRWTVKEETDRKCLQLTSVLWGQQGILLLVTLKSTAMCLDRGEASLFAADLESSAESSCTCSSVRKSTIMSFFLISLTVTWLNGK